MPSFNKIDLIPTFLAQNIDPIPKLFCTKFESSDFKVGGSIRIEPSRQLLDDCTHKRNSKRKVGKPIYH